MFDQSPSSSSSSSSSDFPDKLLTDKGGRHKKEEEEWEPLSFPLSPSKIVIWEFKGCSECLCCSICEEQKKEIIFLWEPAALSFDWHEIFFLRNPTLFPRSSVHFLPPPLFFTETKNGKPAFVRPFLFFPRPPPRLSVPEGRTDRWI